MINSQIHDLTKFATVTKIIRLTGISTNEPNFDFILIGLVCNLSSYRLAGLLNADLEMNLMRGDDHFIYFRQHEIFFQTYIGQEEDEEATVRLLANKNGSNLLLRELPFVDYLLTLHHIADQQKIGNLQRQLQNLPYIQWFRKEEPNKLKSKHNLTFE